MHEVSCRAAYKTSSKIYESAVEAKHSEYKEYQTCPDEMMQFEHGDFKPYEGRGSQLYKKQRGIGWMHVCSNAESPDAGRDVDASPAPSVASTFSSSENSCGSM